MLALHSRNTDVAQLLLANNDVDVLKIDARGNTLVRFVARDDVETHLFVRCSCTLC